jgi:nucleoside-diphosphate-sugar epimerase
MFRNIRMIRNLVEALLKKRPSSTIYLSSVDVYGRTPPLPITEETILGPEHPYAVSKVVGEALFGQIGSDSSPVTVLRLPGVYGPGDGGRSVLGRLTAQILRDNRVTLTGNADVRRDYLPVEMLCEIVQHCLEKPVQTTLNAATGESLTIRQWVEHLARELGRSPEVRQEGAEPEAAGDLVFDVTRLLHLLPNLTIRKRLLQKI